MEGIPAKRSLSVSNIEGNGEAHENGKKKPERGIYHPPSGKYSTTATLITPPEPAAPKSNNFQGGKRRTFSHGANNRRGRHY